MSTQIAIPKTCCRCAQKQGVHSWKIPSLQVRTRYYVIGYDIQTTPHSFNVLVCETCRNELENIQNKSNLLIIAFILAGAIIAPIWANYPALGLLYVVSGGSAGWCLGFIISSIFKIKYRYILGSYDGKHYTFVNQEYQSQFAVFNSNLAGSGVGNNYNQKIVEAESQVPAKKSATKSKGWIACTKCGTTQPVSNTVCPSCKSVFEE